MSYTISRRRLLALTGISAAAVVPLVACSGEATPGQTTDGGTTAAGEVTGQNVRVWFMEGSIADEAIEYLEAAFAEANPGNTLTVEIQPWDGIVSKLQTSLASDSESPDLVETGNTQSSTFGSVGAFAPVDDMYDELGGDDLIPSFIESGSWEGALYSLPLYAGARGVFYRKDLLEAAGIEVPGTIEEFAQAAIDLGAANPEGVEGFSGMYLAAVDVHGANSMLFAGGGDWATLDGDAWQEKLTDPKSQEALERISRVFKDGTAYALDSQASQKAFEKYFNENKVGMLIGTGNIGTKIDQALWDADKVGVMPIPGLEEGEVGQTFAGGSHISLAAKAKNPELAREALRIIFGEEFQTLLGEAGWVSGNTAYGDTVAGAFGEIAADVVKNSKTTPNTPQWGVASGNNLIRDFWTAIAQGGDVASVAADYGSQVQDVLNS